MTRAEVTAMLRMWRPTDCPVPRQWHHEGPSTTTTGTACSPTSAESASLGCSRRRSRTGSFPPPMPKRPKSSTSTPRLLATELTLEATLLRVAETFEHAVIPFRVLKGPAVAHLDYPDPALRDFGDIDLLIQPDDLDRTIAVLTEQGFARRFPEPRAGFDRRFTKSVSVVNPGGKELDLHRTLAPGVFGLRVKVAMLWDATPVQFVLGGRTLVRARPGGTVHPRLLSRGARKCPAPAGSAT